MLVVNNSLTMQWPDTFALDDEGWLWFVSNKLQLFATDTMTFSGSDVNVRVWKVFVGEKSYLWDAKTKTTQKVFVGQSLGDAKTKTTPG